MFKGADAHNRARSRVSQVLKPKECRKSTAFKRFLYIPCLFFTLREVLRNPQYPPGGLSFRRLSPPLLPAMLLFNIELLFSLINSVVSPRVVRFQS